MDYFRLTVTLLYYMLTLNSQTLIPGSFYLNNFILAFLELPAVAIGKIKLNLLLFKYISETLNQFVSTKVVPLVPGIRWAAD